MANAQEGALHYRFGDTLPEPGTTLEVAPGVRWLRMRLPFALDHINLWLLRDRLEGVDGWTLIDCGIADDDTRANWERIFATQLQGLPVLRVIVTHMHPDHLGLAHWLCARWSSDPDAEPSRAGAHILVGNHSDETVTGEARGRECRLWISATDWHVSRIASQATSDVGGDDAARFFSQHGLRDPAALDQIRARGHYYASMVPAVPDRFRRLLGGMHIRIGGHDWHCHVGYGHAPEHIALHAPALNLLIAGDMVLPRISTNVSVVHTEPEADPLTLYLDSIERLRTLPAETLVLPSHGKPFTGLHTRIDQLQAHHAERFDEVLAACAESPRSAADLLLVLFKRKLDLHQTTFAMGESVAHLHALAGRGLLAPVPGEDRVLRWRSVGR